MNNNNNDNNNNNNENKIKNNDNKHRKKKFKKRGALDENRLSVGIIDSDGRHERWNIRPASQLRSLFRAYAAKFHFDVRLLRFYLDGVLLSEDQTSLDVGIEDGDNIDVVFEPGLLADAPNPVLDAEVNAMLRSPSRETALVVMRRLQLVQATDTTTNKNPLRAVVKYLASKPGSQVAQQLFDIVVVQLRGWAHDEPPGMHTDNVPITRTVLEWSLFRSKSECVSDEELRLWEHYDRLRSIYERHAGGNLRLSLVPRISLDNVEKLVRGPSCEVVATFDCDRNSRRCQYSDRDTMLARIAAFRLRARQQEKTPPPMWLDVAKILLIAHKTSPPSGQANGVFAPQCPAVSAATGGREYCGDGELMQLLIEAHYRPSGDDLFTLASRACGIGDHVCLENLRALARHKIGCGQNAAVGRASNYPIHVAAAAGDLELVKNLVEVCGVREVNTPVSCDFVLLRVHLVTPLQIAAANGHLDMCKYLVEEHDVAVDSVALRLAREATTPEAIATLRYLKSIK